MTDGIPGMMQGQRLPLMNEQELRDALSSLKARMVPLSRELKVGQRLPHVLLCLLCTIPKKLVAY
jgi:hypothetical protein